MAIKLYAYGGYAGELGGVQIVVEDTITHSKFMLDIGQRPDHTNQYYSFPGKPKRINDVDISRHLDLFPDMDQIYSHDIEERAGRTVGKLPLEGILLTHPHYDHAGGMRLIRYDMPIYMSRDAKKVLYAWQETTGGYNEFLDLHERFSRKLNNQGQNRPVTGEVTKFARKIERYEERVPFKLGSFTVTPYRVDHSTPGSYGFIVESLGIKLGITGDLRIRGRHPERTQEFLEELVKADLDYLMCEGSLLDMDHRGTEKDVENAIYNLIKDKQFAAITYPPRDFERLTSAYLAAKKSGRMLLISTAQAIGLKLFDGEEGYPKLDWKYIGVFAPPKGKGNILGGEGYEEYYMEDYRSWEKQFLLPENRWTADKGHLPKQQWASVDEVGKNQEKFLLYLVPSQAGDILARVKPRNNSLYLRSHPKPWTDEMRWAENILLNILARYNLKPVDPKNILNPRDIVKIYQVHVTGHFNLEEEAWFLSHFDCPIIPYHCKDEKYYRDDVARLIAPKELKLISFPRATPIILEKRMRA